MSTLCKTYSHQDMASQAVEELLAEGTSPRAIRLLRGSPLHDIRQEPVGGFAGPVGPDALVGTFGGAVCLRRQGAGGFAGDPDRQRQGSFGDVERDVIVTFARGTEHARMADHRELRRLLSVVASAGEQADDLVEELHDGHALVVVELAETTAGDPQARFARPARVA